MTGPELLINTNGLLCGKIKTYAKEGKYISEGPASVSSMWDLKLCGSSESSPENNLKNGR